MPSIEQKELTKAGWWFQAVVFALILLILTPSYYLHGSTYGLLEYAILPFHEAGHFILMPFASEFWVVAGGSIAQILLPLAFAVYFWWKRQEVFSAAVALYWMFASMQQMAVYMADARFLLLPILGSDPTEAHDWNCLFGKMHLLNQSVAIADVTHGLGRLGMAASLCLMFVWLMVNWRTSQSTPVAGVLDSLQPGGGKLSSTRT